MKYTVIVTRAAEKQIKKLKSNVVAKIINAIDALAMEPRSNNVTKLSGKNGFYRVRVGITVSYTRLVTRS